MSWKIALLVGLLNAVLTALVTAPVADKVTGMHRMSNFEGKRGYAIAFVFIPAGFIGGFLLGLLGTRLVGALEWAQFWRAAGVSVLLGQLALFGIAGLSLLTIVRPPLLDGERLALEVEVLVPQERLTPRSTAPDQIRMSLFAGAKDNHYAVIDRSAFRHEQGRLVVKALADLNSKASFRMLAFSLEEHLSLALDPLPLPPAPTAKHLAWSEPMPMREATITGPEYTYTDVLLRFRVVKQGAGRP